MSSLAIGALLILAQSCSAPQIESASLVSPANWSPSSLRVGTATDDELVNYIQRLPNFKKLAALNDEHGQKVRSRKIRAKKFTPGEPTEIKNKVELRALLAQMTTDPDAALAYLDATTQATTALLIELADLGLGPQRRLDLIKKACEPKQVRQNGAKLDCHGACSGGLNVALDQANTGYNYNMAACVSGALLGYGGVMFTGPFSPVGIMFVAAGEASCIGYAYFNYLSNFEYAIQGFDNCSYACGA